MKEDTIIEAKVVLVDDNDMTRTMLRGILRQEGIDVVGEAKDGKCALDIVKRTRPTLVCLDVLMPIEGGIDALKKIKVEHPEVKVLMITGSTERETVQAALSNGASGYVVKPFNAAKVLAAIRQALGQAKPAPKEVKA